MGRSYGGWFECPIGLGGSILWFSSGRTLVPDARAASEKLSLVRPDVRIGSWLCENAKTLNRNRRSYSSKTVLVAQRASGFNLEIELKNIILRHVSIFEFLHSQGQSRTWTRVTA